MEYDYDRELFYHVGPGGFRFKVQDIVLMVLVAVIFGAVAGFEAIIYFLQRLNNKSTQTDFAIPVLPIQEVPEFKTQMYHIRQELPKKSKKKPTTQGKFEQTGDELCECMICGFKVGRPKN